jgi:sarcosine oxidase
MNRSGPVLRCAIVGAGAVGAATALALARAGAHVTLFDRFSFFHDRGASHGPTRLFRTAYFEHPDYVPLLKRARLLWRDLETASNERLVFETGVVEAGPPDGFVLSGLREAAQAHDLPIENLKYVTLDEKCRGLKLPKSFEAVFEKEAGFLRADKILAAQIRLAQSLGAELRPNTRIENWETGRQTIMVKTSAGVENFDRLILACGPWASELLGAIGITIQPVPKALFWRQPASAEFSADAGFTPFAIETEEARMFYGFPAIDGDGVKFGEHTGLTPIKSAEDRPSTPSASDSTAAEEFLARFIPSLADRPGKQDMCVYEMSPDQHFVIDRHPACPERISFAAGLSGHGFKFAPVIAEALSALALGEGEPPGFGFLSLRRFAKTA